MSKFICQSCRISLRRRFRVQGVQIIPVRKYSSEIKQSDRPIDLPASRTAKGKLDITALLSKPTWSVRSLLPPDSAPPSTEITPQKLHHLLRLSALPLPKTPEEELSMLATLHSQLHFVKNIQDVDTEGVEPLQSLRDETEEGIRDVTIGLETLKEALGEEDIKGRNRRPRRRRERLPITKGVEDWNVLKTAGETVETPIGKYFIVRSGKGDSPGSSITETKGSSLDGPEIGSAKLLERNGP